MSVAGPVKNDERVRGELPLFEEIFKLHHRKVYAICFRMTGEATEAEDLTQEVFVQVFRKLDTFRGESAFTTWLHRLTINQVLMHFRKRRSTKMELTEDGELPERTIQGINILKSFTIVDRLALDEAILRLAPGYRTAFILHDIEGLEHQEIANILGCSVGTSKSQLHKARMKMRSLLRPRIDTGKETTACQQIPEGLERLPASQSTPAHQPPANRSKLIEFLPAQA
jgi:RNA polymerase sigma-70 factor (ECF subfamily)